MTPATYQDVIDAPPHMVAEIAGGVLHLTARPAPRHAYASAQLRWALGPYFDDGGGWIILHQPELHFGADVLVPDIAGWRVERMPYLPEAYFETPPDWICEVLSPSTIRFDLAEKRELYAAAGVGFLWLVEPVTRTLEAFELHGSSWLLLGTAAGDDKAAFAPFGEFQLSRLWAPMAGEAHESLQQASVGRQWTSLR